MPSFPLVSIVIPAFNCQETLEAALKSLSAQTYPNVEIVCVNDGSTDKTGDVLDAASADMPNLHIVETQNQGAYMAREAGIRHATGSFIGFCDSDDTMEATMVERMMERALSDNADLVVTAFRSIHPDGSESTSMDGFPLPPLATNEDSGWLCAINTALWNKLFSKGLIEKRTVLSKPPRVMEDALFLFSLFPFIQTISFVPDPLYRYYIREDDSMSRVAVAELDGFVTSWKETRHHTQEVDSRYLDIFDLGSLLHLGVSTLLNISKNQPESFSQTYDFLKTTLLYEFPRSRNNRFMTRHYVKDNPAMRRTHLAYFCFSHGLMKPALTAYGALCQWMPQGRW